MRAIRRSIVVDDIEVSSRATRAKGVRAMMDLIESIVWLGGCLIEQS